ncbi:MAG: zinc-binding dehydrogenase [Candidatus Microthrix sp.]|jgi:NADPH2:quinone reductase|uniref:zinc-binding dehydrogenase n=1 Tax=Candidatus Neomicrothrix parvicella TaxID=41950 RepID=UPI0003626A0C|nr:MULTISPECIES: zinc-binding dehydrogenase [Microthrix]MBK6503136.1 zinc-binding dehydrogenase [Candidatus Microthrix sp.]MBK7020964.1 zinc-binding dehydrogenase [Candidatus Microthrix sp.]MBK7321672.1 zinc-binding dehydrogenase [Candidatus Microthrix sp.]
MTRHDVPKTALELRSTLTGDGVVTLGIEQFEVDDPTGSQVVIRVEAAPINPSDQGMLFAMGDASRASAVVGTGLPAVAVPVSDGAVAGQRGRVDQPMPVGNEGAGTVVAAGPDPTAQALLNKVVGFLSGNAYAQYRTIDASQCLVMQDGTDPADAAAAFVNPLTALGMIETMKTEGHTALVHTVGASNLGQILNRVCRADGIGLVNVVRSQEHVDLLREAGADVVCNSSDASFHNDLEDALRSTGATIAFDAIGGGELADTLLSAMERVAGEQADGFSRYGSDTHKQVYIYGGLDRGPTTLSRSYGMSWALGGWLLTPFLQNIGKEAVDRLRTRVADEITTTFAGSYGMVLSLEDAVDPEMVKRYAKMATGDKALVTPQA